MKLIKIGERAKQEIRLSNLKPIKKALKRRIKPPFWLRISLIESIFSGKIANLNKKKKEIPIK